MDDDRINQAVGAELRAARARKGWTRNQLVEASGVNGMSIRRYEEGVRAVPVDTLVRLIAALELEIADIDRAIRKARDISGPSPGSIDRSSAARRMRAKARKGD